MKWHIRVLVGAAFGLTLVAAIGVVNHGRAADDKDTKEALEKLAHQIAKNEESKAKESADALAKSAELEAVMHLFALRTKKGAGVGTPAEKITPDGIEAKLIALGRKALPPKQLEKEANAIAQAAYISAAIAEISVRKAPEKKEGPKDPKDWIAWSKEMKSASLDLAKAAKSKDAKGVKDAASKVNSSCNNCHGVFRD